MNLNDLPQVAKPQFQLKKLLPWHKQAASLLAQGLGRGEISAALKCTPEYITMLSHQKLFSEYVQHMTGFADIQLQALFEKGVGVLGTAMREGSMSEKIDAAKTVLRAVGKDGSKGDIGVSVKFVVNVPEKSISSEQWARDHQPREVHALPE
jgi:hypothetical protein